MVFDRLENFADYATLAPEAWSRIAGFFRQLSAETPSGKYEIWGDRIYASVNRIESHALDTDKLEYHTKYADIQLVASGVEDVLCGDLTGEVTTAYDASRDVGFYRLEQVSSQYTLTPGKFLLLLPGEGHAPDVGDGSAVVKVVVKVAADCFGAVN